MMSHEESEILASVLDRLERCPVCHHTHRTGELQVVQRDERFWLVQVECSECHRQTFVAAVLEQGSAAEARRALRELTAARTEVTPFDAEPLALARPAQPPETGERVSADDVIDMYVFLREFDGDFHRHFRETRG